MRRPGIMILLLLLALTVSCSGRDARDASPEGATRSSTTGATADSSPGASTTGAAAPSTSGCGRAPDAPEVTDELPGDVEQTITVAGTVRTYRLGVPDGYDPEQPTPLVMNLHGSGSNAVQASLYGGVTQGANERGILTITPDAIDGQWQIGAKGTDGDFLKALVADIESRYCVDPDRVYVIGMSLGAWKAAVTACAMADTFAAAALVTVEVHPDSCPPIPVVAFHGTADETVPYGEGSGHSFPDSPNAGLPGTHENIASWADGNGCDPDPKVTEIGDDVERWAYTDCTADVVLYTVTGAGHTWPGADIEIGPTTQIIDATCIAFDWFAAHPRSD
ncbi:MAG TPA: PHB depolymerase family esterase [Acidimicrobiales bacterium]|nr:PHB depolymerase family esterase [Acidimicrobiales bacterium]